MRKCAGAIARRGTHQLLEDLPTLPVTFLASVGESARESKRIGFKRRILSLSVNEARETGTACHTARVRSEAGPQPKIAMTGNDIRAGLKWPIRLRVRFPTPPLSTKPGQLHY